MTIQRLTIAPLQKASSLREKKSISYFLSVYLKSESKINVTFTAVN